MQSCVAFQLWTVPLHLKGNTVTILGVIYRYVSHRVKDRRSVLALLPNPYRWEAGGVLESHYTAQWRCMLLLYFWHPEYRITRIAIGSADLADTS